MHHAEILAICHIDSTVGSNRDSAWRVQLVEVFSTSMPASHNSAVWCAWSPMHYAVIPAIHDKNSMVRSQRDGRRLHKLV